MRPSEPPEILDCVVVGAGPAGVAATLYLARYHRRFSVVDGGEPHARWIPTSHNIPFFERGIGGQELLARQRANVEQYGTRIVNGCATSLERHEDRFIVVTKRRAQPSGRPPGRCCSPPARSTWSPSCQTFAPRSGRASCATARSATAMKQVGAGSR